MDRRTTNIVAYITWIGLLIAIIAGDREESKFHVNQALVIWLAGLICALIPCIGWLAGIFVFVCAIMGLISAINDEEKPVPLLGNIQILK